MLHDKDLRIDVFRASGAGGQHVNVTDSAVRITHLPTNTVVSIQDERSQHKNKEKAMSLLRSRIYEQQRNKLNAERAKLRSSQIGTGDRSERVRTYNVLQSRVTDHRINYSVHSVEQVLDGTMLGDIIDKLREADRQDRLAELAQPTGKTNSGNDKR